MGIHRRINMSKLLHNDSKTSHTAQSQCRFFNLVDFPIRTSMLYVLIYDVYGDGWRLYYGGSRIGALRTILCHIRGVPIIEPDPRTEGLALGPYPGCLKLLCSFHRRVSVSSSCFKSAFMYYHIRLDYRSSLCIYV